MAMSLRRSRPTASPCSSTNGNWFTTKSRPVSMRRSASAWLRSAGPTSGWVAATVRHGVAEGDPAQNGAADVAVGQQSAELAVGLADHQGTGARHLEPPERLGDGSGRRDRGALESCQRLGEAHEFLLPLS